MVTALSGTGAFAAVTVVVCDAVAPAITSSISSAEAAFISDLIEKREVPKNAQATARVSAAASFLIFLTLYCLLSQIRCC